MCIDFIIAIILIAPLLGAIIAGFFSQKINITGVHFCTIGLVALSFILSLCLVYGVYVENEICTASYFNWAVLPNLTQDRQYG